MRFRTGLAALLSLLAAAAGAFAQASAPASRAADWQVSVMTFGPGPVIYERYGHCAIRLRNDALGVDVCYDWGNFDFDDPNFLGRFLAGELRYWMEGKRTGAVLDAYIRVGDRSVTEQRLNLSPAQAARLIDRIRAQDDDVNRYYGYDYFRDNCATRVRDGLDEATEGALRRALATPVPRTLRYHNRRVSAVGATNGLLCVLMDFAGGPRIDAPMTRWDEAFVPTTLADTLDEVRLVDGGDDRPLVASRAQLHLTTTPGNLEPARPPRLVGWTLPVGAVGGLLLVGLARSAPRGFRALASAWSAFAGLGGALVIALWAFTGHWATGWNANLLQFSPLSLVVLVALWPRPLRPIARPMALAIAGLSVAGALVTLSHLARQSNAPAVALALPLNLAVAYGLTRVVRRAAAATAIGDPLTARITP